MSAADTAAMARRLLDQPEAKTAGIRPRAAALLARQALEEALDALWKTKGLPLGAFPTRSPLSDPRFEGPVAEGGMLGSGSIGLQVAEELRS